MKNCFKLALEDPKKNIAKKYEKHEIVRFFFFSNFRGLSYPFYKLFEATFQ